MQRYLNMSHNEFQVAREKQTIRKGMHKHNIKSATSELNLKIGHINKQAIKAKNTLLDSQPDASVLDTKSATQVQVSDSYHADNERFEAVVESLSNDNAELTDVGSNKPEVESESLSNAIEQSNSDSESTEAVDILDGILAEINHG